MRNPLLWKPTKITTVPRRGHGQDSASGGVPDVRVVQDGGPAGLAPGSTLMATLAGRWYAQALAQHARGTLLELGAGAMPYHALYRGQVNAVWATDWPQSLHLQPHADLFCDLNAGIPLCSGMADTVIAADLLEHIYRPQALLLEMARVLRPGGCVLLNTPFMYWVHEAPHDYFRYTPHALQRMAQDAGLQVLQLDALGGALCVLADIAGKLVHGRGAIGAALARGVQRATLALQAPLPRSASSPLLVAAVLQKPA